MISHSKKNKAYKKLSDHILNLNTNHSMFTIVNLAEVPVMIKLKLLVDSVHVVKREMLQSLK